MAETETKNRICFTVSNNNDGVMTVNSVQIDGKDDIQINEVLTGENVGDIAANIVTKGNAPAPPPALTPVPEPVAAPERVANSVPVANSGASSVPAPAPVANSVLAQNASTTLANVPVADLSPDEALTKLKNIQLTGRYQVYTLDSLIEDLKRDGGVRSYGRGKLYEFIQNNAVDWSNRGLNGDQITKAIIDGIIEAGKGGENWNIGFTQRGTPKVNRIILGGSHLTRKSSYNRRRRQSTTRKGRRSSRRRR